jgi:hypothetical protein
MISMATTLNYNINLLIQSAFTAYRKAYAENGLIGLLRLFPHLHVAPPLIISKDELLDGFERQDRSLKVLDDALGFH